MTEDNWSIDNLRKLVAKTDSASSENVEQKDGRIYQKLALLEEGILEEEIVKRFAKEDQFLKYFEDNPDVVEDGENKVKNREISSDVISLYYLLVKGKIEDLYQKACERDPEVANLDPVDVKAELAMSFLERTHKKNKEEIPKGIDPVTFGVEVELDLPETIVKNEFLKSISELRMAGLLYGMSTNLDEIASSEMLYGEDIAKVKAVIKLTGLKATSIEDYLKIFDGNSNVLSTLETIRDGMYRYEYMSQEEEISSKPTLGYRQYMRELLYLKLSGMNADRWNFHETIAGIELSPEHTEIMESLLIAASAGLTPPNKVEEAIEKSMQEDSWVDPTPEIRYQKSSDDGNVYPLHKTRTWNEVEEYPYDSPILNVGKYGVELRGVGEYTLEEYPIAVRHARFIYHCGHAIRALQKSEGTRNKKENLLVDAWQEMTNEWKKILQESGLDVLKSEDFSLDLDTQYSEIEQSNYATLFGDLMLRGYLDQEFYKENRRVVREFNKRVSNTISAD